MRWLLVVMAAGFVLRSAANAARALPAPDAGSSKLYRWFHDWVQLDASNLDKLAGQADSLAAPESEGKTK